MRIKLATRPAALFGAMFVAALIALMPMRFALAVVGLGDYGLTAREVTGPVWAARINEAHVGDVVLGDARAALSPLALLVGRARIAVSGPGPLVAAGNTGTDNNALRGAVEVNRHSFAIESVSAALPVGGALGALPVSRLDLSDVSVRFDNGSCSEAQGRVKAMLNAGIPGVALSQGMTGAARCDGGALLLPLVSQAGTETVNLRIRADGRYRGELVVQVNDPALASQLELAGFQPGPAGYMLAIEGRL